MTQPSTIPVVADYPGELERKLVLRDGTRLRLRPVRPDDQDRLVEARGIRRFRAYVLASNGRMIDLLNRFTDVRERRVQDGVVEIAFVRRAPIAP